MKIIDTEESKLGQPCFEAYLRGAWWEIDILQRRSEMLCVRFTQLENERDSWLPLNRLRLRARKCDHWDCLVLRHGVEVSVHALHPEAQFVKLSTNVLQPALYDARIVSVSRAPHKPDCYCKFSVQFFCVNEEFPKHGVVRRLIPTGVLKEVNIESISILQQPGLIPVHEVLKAHISGKWKVNHGRWSNDAVFLKETELRIFRNSKGEESITYAKGDPPDLSEPDVIPGRRTAHQQDGNKSLKWSIQETNRLGSKLAAGEGEVQPQRRMMVDQRRNKTGPTEKEFHYNGLKRKQEAMGEKHISNRFQENQSPELRSPLPRSFPFGVPPRKEDRKVAYHGTGKREDGHHKEGKVLEIKRRRRLNIVGSGDEHSDGPEERLQDNNKNSKSNRGVLLERGKTGHDKCSTANHGMQKMPDSGWRGSVVGADKPECTTGKNTGRLQQNGKEQPQPPFYEMQKGGLSGDDCRQGKLESKSLGRKRGLVKIGMSKPVERIVLDDNESPQNTGISLGKFTEIGAEASPIPIPNLESTHKARAFSGSEQIESVRGPDVNVSKGKQDEDLTHLERSSSDQQIPSPSKGKAKEQHASGRFTSEKVDNSKQNEYLMPVETSSSDQQIVKGTSKKEPQAANEEEGGKDGSLAKRDAYLTTSRPNLEHPADESMRRKLRPRPGKLEQTKLRDDTRLPKNSGKGKDANKVPDRPLYMDLLENNFKDEANEEKLWEAGVHVEGPSVEFGLNDTWDPIGDDSISDSDCKPVSKEDPVMEKVWQEFFLQETPAATEKATKPDLQDAVIKGCKSKVQITECKDDISKVDHEEGQCQHDFFLKPDAGLVCDNCGIISVPIEDLVPQVDCCQRRPREMDLDDWDFDCSLDLDQGGARYNVLESGKEVTMLSTCLPPHYAQVMHPHQKDGFEFLWRNLSEGSGKLRKRKLDKNAGCILSHAPGTGKTFLVISFLKSYMDKFPGCQPLIVAPKIMLLAWEKEFTRWKSDIKVFILNTARSAGRRLIQKHEESGIINLKSHQMNPREVVDAYRMAMLFEWINKRSVCLVSYNLFSSLTEEGVSNRSKVGDSVRQTLLASPGILILDEGHFPRNKDTRIRKALMRVGTNARILLSGTLFQNNFEELFNTLYLVRPGFVEAFSSSHVLVNQDEEKFVADLDIQEVTGAAEKKARKLFVEEVGMKIEQGQLCKGSEILLRHGLQRLRGLTAEFVHHYTGEVLASLPGLRDFGILLKPTPLQCTLLELVNKVFQNSEDLLKREIAVSEASIHPSLLLGLEFVKDLRSDGKGGHRTAPRGELSTKLKELALLKEVKNPVNGVKTKFVFDLLCSLRATKEKVLIFSQHISPLLLLESMFVSAFNWDKRKDVLKLDGNLAMCDRQIVIEQFNDPNSETRVLLASTKACGEGISLIGASRVIFLDVLWNPAVIKQAVSRAFRLGQKKTVYVYRLIASGTIEEKKYKKAIRKDWLSKAIFCPAAGETGSCLDQPEEHGESLERVQVACLEKSDSAEEILAWEIDGSTCEDDLLEKLLEADGGGPNSFLKVVEHGSAFHNRKSGCGPDARQWFLEDWEEKDIPYGKERREGEGEAPGTQRRDPEKVAAKLYQDFGGSQESDVDEIPSGSETDEEDL